MIIYRDVVSGDEVGSDAAKLDLLDDVIFKTDSSTFIDEDDPDAGPKNNVLHTHDLRETQFDKKSYGMQVKGYMAKVVTHLQAKNPSRVDAFKAGAQKFISGTVLPNFADFQFYMGKEMNPEGMIILGRYEEGKATPTFYFWRDGCVGEKV